MNFVAVTFVIMSYTEVKLMLFDKSSNQIKLHMNSGFEIQYHILFTASDHEQHTHTKAKSDAK